jgi:uncharacterized protein YjbI with pentapeptide repeats
MGDEQSRPEQSVALAQAEPSAGERWGDPIPPERAAELRELADRQRRWVASAPDGQRDLDESVFRHVRLTGAEVFWLAAYALAGPEGDLEAVAVQLRDASVRNSGATVRDSLPMLSSLHLQGADLGEAQLQGVYFRAAQLQGAHLTGAQLQGVDLFRAQLQTLYVNTQVRESTV